MGIKVNSLFVISLLLLFVLSSSSKLKNVKKSSNLKHKAHTQIKIEKNDNFTYAITKEKCSVTNCNGDCTSTNICTCEEGYLVENSMSS